MTFTLTEESVLDAFTTDQRMAEKCVEVSQDLVNKKYDISSLVEILGFALTSKEVELRVNGTRFLSLTLAKLPPDYLSPVQLDFIVAFYCDRLKDHHNVIPAIIDGLTSLVQMKNLSDGSVTKIVTNFFQHVSCQSQNREDREKIYNLIKSIVADHSAELLAMGANFIYNVINAMDSERDPRNLVLLFDFMPTFIKQFPLHHLAEEMFETFACYFPVDFHPMKDDPKSISRDALAEKLSYCLVASDDFAEWAIPLALEKLESDLIVAKLDSLRLLSRCAERFKPELMEEHFDDIWTRLKSEILPGSGNSEIVSEGFVTLDAILLNAAQNPDVSKNVETKILSNIIPYVSNTNHHLFAPAFRIADCCVNNNTAFAGEKILGAVAVRLREEGMSLDAKIKFIAKAQNILEICASKETFTGMDPTTLGEIQKDLLNSLRTSDPDLINLAWLNIEHSIGIFSEIQRDELYSRLVDALANSSNRVDLSGVLSKYATTFGDEVNTKVVNEICNNFPKLSKNSKRNVYLNFVVLVQIPKFSDQILNLLTKQIFEIENRKEVGVALSALQKLLESNLESALVSKIWNNYNMLDNFRELIQSGSLDKDVLTQISVVISLFVRQLTVEEQQAVVDKCLPLIQLNNPSDLFIMHGILSHVDQKVSIGSHFSALVTKLVHMCLEIEDETVRRVGNTLVCTLVNRIERTEENSAAIKQIIKTLREEIKKEKKSAVETLSWVAKGLIVGGFEEAGDIIEDISKLLEHPTLFEAAELAFDVISVEVPELDLPMVKLLFKQKIFHVVLHKLWDKLVKFEESHINAFAFVLGMAPHPVLKMYLEKVGPIIFKCIESKKAKTVQIGLRIIKRFLQEQSDYFRSHFNHLIPQLLKLSSYIDSMVIRISALECLEVICKYPVFVVQPYKVDVILELASPLDDKKRLVRNAAVKTRNAWFLIGTDTSKDNK